MTTAPEVLDTYRAVQALAGVCDGARTWDAQGFNGRDVEFGHSLANKDFASWTPKMYRAAYKMLRTYRNTQLPTFGIDYATLLPRLPQPGWNWVAGPIEIDAEGVWTYALFYCDDVVTTGTDFAVLAETALVYNRIARGQTTPVVIFKNEDEYCHLEAACGDLPGFPRVDQVRFAAAA